MYFLTDKNHETSSDQFSFSYVEGFCWKETKVFMLFMLMAPIPHPLSATTAGVSAFLISLVGFLLSV